MSASLSLERLLFDPAEIAAGPKVGSYIVSGDGNVIGDSDVSGDKGLNVYMLNAADFDIRDLTHVSDSVKIGDGTDLLAVNADGSINAVVTATLLDIRALTNADVVTAEQGTSPWVVSASNLDIRDLSHASDSVKIGDGTDLLAVNADGSINVLGSITVGVPDTAILSTATAMTATAAAVVSSALANRKVIQVQNVGANAVYLGPAAVTAANGLKVEKGATESLELGPSVALYGICDTAKTSSLRILEIS